jgi:hypothetical protein
MLALSDSSGAHQNQGEISGMSNDPSKHVRSSQLNNKDILTDEPPLNLLNMPDIVSTDCPFSSGYPMVSPTSLRRDGWTQ